MGGKGGTYENVIFLTGWGGGGGGERKRLAPSPEPLQIAFCAIARNKARLILLHIHLNHETLSQHTNLNKQVFNELQIFCRQNRNNKYEFTDRVPRV